MSFWDIFIGALFLVICFLLIVVVLLQKGRGGGLSAALGGMGSSAFGTRTGDVFTWVTIVLTGLFLLLAVAASLIFHPAAERVATPTFLPEPGALGEPTNVNISCMTRGASIYYTTKGEEPDENATFYNKPVRVEPPMTLKARAYRDTWKASHVAEAHYALAPTSRPRSDANTPGTAPARPDANVSGGMRAAPPAGRPASAPAKG
jgi:preprotein translocase subunit SecG